MADQERFAGANLLEDRGEDVKRLFVKERRAARPRWGWRGAMAEPREEHDLAPARFMQAAREITPQIDRAKALVKEDQGAPGGVAGDVLSYTARPWGFDPRDVQAKTLILAGQADPIAGNAHAAWYKKAVPDSRVEMVPGVGHLVIAQAWGRVLSHLAPGTKA